MGNKEKIIGFGVLSVLAIMYFRNKGTSSILENKFNEAINVEKSLEVIPDIISKLKQGIQEVPTFPRFVPSNRIIQDRIRSNNANIVTEIGVFSDIQQSLNLDETLNL